MRSRQHATPVLIGPSGSLALTPLTLAGGEGAISEADIQALVHAFPTALPIAEIDPAFVGAVAICRELNTAAGPIDNVLVTPSGMPVLVECKLWRNPEGRREVVGQILDYAKELRRWSASDLQREARRRLGGIGNPLMDLIRAADPAVDEIAFNDALTANLRRGRFLLLIIGDGIREGVEAIAEYLQAQAGMQFSLGLVEMPIYRLPDGSQLVAPRVLAKTLVVTRTVIALPEGLAIQEEQESAASTSEPDPDRTALSDSQQRFWAEFLGGLRLDDPEQSIPRPARMGYIAFGLPASNGQCWLTVYRDMRQQEVGVFLSANKTPLGDRLLAVTAEDSPDIFRELGGTPYLSEKEGRLRVADRLPAGNLDDPDARAQAFVWLRSRVNEFVNVLRPRIRSVVADFTVGA